MKPRLLNIEKAVAAAKEIKGHAFVYQIGFDSFVAVNKPIKGVLFGEFENGKLSVAHMEAIKICRTL